MTNSFYKLQQLTYIEKDYAGAISLLESDEPKNTVEKELLVNLYFRQYDFQKCIEIYRELNDFYKIGYCYLMLNSIDSAKKFLSKAEDSPAKNWSLFFCELFDEKVKHFPTYLQIRMFLERDLNLFLKLSLTKFVQKFADISDYLCDINPEANKFFAKAFLYNNYNEYALIFLNRGLEYTTQDAEIYYLLGVYYFKENNFPEAKKYLKKAIKVNENYVPASLLLNKIQ